MQKCLHIAGIIHHIENETHHVMLNARPLKVTCTNFNLVVHGNIEGSEDIIRRIFGHYHDTLNGPYLELKFPTNRLALEQSGFHLRPSKTEVRMQGNQPKSVPALPKAYPILPPSARSSRPRDPHLQKGFDIVHRAYYVGLHLVETTQQFDLRAILDQEGDVVIRLEIASYVVV